MKKILIIASAGLLAACGPDQPPPQAYQPVPVQQAPAYQQPAPAAAPVIVQAAPQSSGMQDMLIGGAIGALATHALTGSGRGAAPAQQVNNTHTRVIERTVIVRQAPARPVAPLPAAVVPPAAPRPAAVPYTAPRTSYAPPARVVPTYSPAPSRRK